MPVSVFFRLFFWLLICFVLASCGTAHRFGQQPATAVFASHSKATFSARPAVVVENLLPGLPVPAIGKPIIQRARPADVKSPGPRLPVAALATRESPLASNMQAPETAPATPQAAAAAMPLQVQMEPQITSRLAIAGLASAILAMLPFVSGLSLLLAIPFALAGLLLSYLGKRQVEEMGLKYKGLVLAKAGMAISVVLLSVLALMGAAALFAL